MLESLPELQFSSALCADVREALGRERVIDEYFLRHHKL